MQACSVKTRDFRSRSRNMFAITLLILSLGVSAYAQISSGLWSPSPSTLSDIGGPTDTHKRPFLPINEIVRPLGPFVVSKKYVDPPSVIWQPPTTDRPIIDIIGGPISKKYVGPPNGVWQPPSPPPTKGPKIIGNLGGPISKKYVGPPSRVWQPPPTFGDPIFGSTESPFGGPIGPVSKRDGEEDEDIEIETLVGLLTDTIDKVQKDISSDDLAKAAQQVKDLADNIIVNTGGQVDHQDVLDLVSELGAEIDGGDVDVSFLFDDPLKFEARTLWFALRLWIELTNRLAALDAAGSSADTTLAAISFTADVIQNALRNTVHLMSDMIKEVKGNPNVTKRQKASFDVSKTWEFDSGSSLKIKGTVSTSNFKNVDFNIGLSLSF